MDNRTLLEQEVDRKVEIDEILAQNNLPADFWVQLFHFSPLRVIVWFICLFSYFKWGGMGGLISALLGGIFLWRKFPVTIQDKEKTIFVYIVNFLDITAEKTVRLADRLYERYMNW